ncbi:MAG: gluconate 2-dehydrogenase subunit 3 family protein [Candidatus Pedobacter colombiensis]|uniref:Gluconate 2-dehydrogenase subunit 3 family protein n=1 Tax=Candidatus Pedobacter colombiensis TaxID=3121371 RepID=A0AAJ6B8B1_9SPHI|nr:gluconate 2-dehydrogenase subunit 3 family protein [Pedobacter sp.]WEK21210.1 MAG: gluconate 2-dehydrogenase subunit 3 family protein [Pedobacter sp.]
MNRRTTIKSILAVGILGTSTFSIFKWSSFRKRTDLFFLTTQRRLIEELSEMIIPRTEAPGAKDANVADFILQTVLYCLDIHEQNNFISGLQDLEDYSIENYKSSFLDCSIMNKNKILKHFENRDVYSYHILNKVRNRLFGRSFFAQLKEFVIVGYCTSEIGATKGLAYDYIPGNYEACISIQPHQKSWATK